MDAYLDTVLKTIAEKRGGEVKNIFPDDYNNPKLRTALTLLANDNYIGQRYSSEFAEPIWTVSIRPEGERFLSTGGFKQATEIRNSPIKANFIAWVAVGISIVAIIVSIIALNHK